MKMLTALAAAVLVVCTLLGGCGQKKNDTARPTATAPAGVSVTKTPEATPTPLLDTDKTIDEAAQEVEDALPDDKENDLDKDSEKKTEASPNP